MVSLLPSATEIAFALGLADQVVGVTFECDYPPDPRVGRAMWWSAVSTRTASTPGRSTRLCASRSPRGRPVHARCRGVPRARPAGRADAGPVPSVRAAQRSGRRSHAAARLPRRRRHHGPAHDRGHLRDHRRGRRCDRYARRADELVAGLRARLDRVADRVAGRSRPRVFVLEWPDPPFVAGHWVPELVEAAGGRGRAGQGGRAVGPDDVENRGRVDPDIVVVSSCGFDAAGSGGPRPRGARSPSGSSKRVGHRRQRPDGPPGPTSSSTASKPWPRSSTATTARRIGRNPDPLTSTSSLRPLNRPGLTRWRLAAGVGLSGARGTGEGRRLRSALDGGPESRSSRGVRAPPRRRCDRRCRAARRWRRRRDQLGGDDTLDPRHGRRRADRRRHIAHRPGPSADRPAGRRSADRHRDSGHRPPSSPTDSTGGTSAPPESTVSQGGAPLGRRHRLRRLRHLDRSVAGRERGRQTRSPSAA